MDLREIIDTITPPDEAARQAARARWNACAKPLGSLGLLESAVEDIAALTGSAEIDLSEKAVLVLCADNGVVRRGVTPTDSGVTAAVARQLALGRTSVCRMAEVAHCRIVPVDMGIRGFAGFAGVLAAPVLQISPLMGSNLIIVVFAVVVIGGMGSIMGAIVTGLGLGVIEGLTKVFWPEASSTVVFIIMAIVLLLRPAGLFGKEK